MNKIFLVFLFLFPSFASFGAENNYAVSKISSSLLKGANAVVRLDSTFVSVENGKVVSKIIKVVTVLNINGNAAAIFNHPYNAFTQIKSIDGRLYDAEGKQVQKLKRGELRDISGFGYSYAFHDDLRMKYYDFEYRQYPYTVEYEYEEYSSTNFLIPSWLPINSDGIAVENSVFVLSHPKKDVIFSKEYNISKNAFKTTEESYKKNDTTLLTSWKLTNQNAVKIVSKLQINEQLPFVDLVSKRTVLLDNVGNFSSWESMGEFFNVLNRDRDSLSPELSQKLVDLTASLPDNKSKIAAVYKFLQKNTRYVANEFGLAGWRTFEAYDVARTGYGDCKGLSNYMKAMLNAIDIPSNLVLIYAGQENIKQLDTTFASNSFNHMILNVPNIDGETVWLECTSSLNPPGYLGGFTQDRYALVLTDKGGKLMKTPSYNASENTLNRKIDVWLKDGEEDAKITWKTDYIGRMQDNVLPLVRSGKEVSIKKRISTILPYKSIKNFTQTYQESLPDFGIPKVQEDIDLVAKNLVQNLSDSWLVTIPTGAESIGNTSRDEGRTLPFYLNESAKYVYKITVHFPENKSISSLPKTEIVNNAFFDFKSTATSAKGEITFEITITTKAGKFTGNQFNEYVDAARTIESKMNSVGFMMN